MQLRVMGKHEVDGSIRYGMAGAFDASRDCHNAFIWGMKGIR
jgi:hypothetical protein